MKFAIKIFLTVLSFCVPAAFALESKPTLYGRVNVSFESVSDSSGSYTSLESNFSKIGIKGKLDLKEELEAVYLLDYEVAYDDSETFRQYNIYVGIKGEFGTGLAGNFDTPLRKVQKDIDLFNFLRGDIRYLITVNENRRANSLMYISPELSGFTGYIAHVSSEDPNASDGGSVALTFKKGAWYAALAFDTNIEEQESDTVRFVGQYNQGPLQLGLLLESFKPAQEESVEEERFDAWMASAKYKFSEVWVGRVQAGVSDMYFKDGTSISIGLDYMMTETFRFYGFYTKESADNNAVDNDYLGLGTAFYF